LHWEGSELFFISIVSKFLNPILFKLESDCNFNNSHIKKSGGQEIEFHEIEIIIFLNWSEDRKGPRCPQGARLD